MNHTLFRLMLVVLSYMTVWFGIATWKKRNDLADVAWGTAFIVGVIFCFLVAPQLTWRSDLLAFMTLIWAVRLSVYIGLRNLGKPEDFRYRKWREEWGKNVFWRSFLQVFILQGSILFVVGLPLWFALLQGEDTPVGFWDVFGGVIWLKGLLYEAIGDAQMASFRKKRKSPHEVMRSGLWKYTRHPNYFGEALLWWGVYLIAVGGGSAPLWSVVGPILLTFLLVRVSGVPMLEKKYEGHSEYLDYQRTTSAFIPWFPKK